MQKKTTIAYILVSISIFTTTLVFQQAITTRREASVFTIADELDLPASAYDEKIRVAIVNSRGNIAPYDNSWKFIEGNPYGAYQLDFDFDTLRKSNFTFIDIVKSNADVLVISSADVLAYEYTDQQIAAIKTYVRQGHGIIMTGASTSSDVDNNRKLYDLFGINNSILLDYMGYSDGEFSFNLTGLTHPVFQGISKNYDPASNTTAAYPVIATSWADVITNGTLIAQSNTTVNAIEAAIIMYNSTWRGLYFSYDIEKYNAASYVYPDLDDYKLMYNSIVWCAKSPMKLHVNNSSLTRGQSIELTAVIRNSFNVSQQIVNYSLTIFNANNGSIVSSAINTSMAPTTEVSIPWLASLAIPRGTYVFSVMVSTLVESSSKSVLISIINKGPTITLNYLPIEVRDDAGPLVFTAAVTDIDDDPITVTWYLDGNAIGTGTSLSIEGKPAFGLHNITIVAFDGFSSNRKSFLLQYNDVLTPLDLLLKFHVFIGFGGWFSIGTTLFFKIGARIRTKQKFALVKLARDLDHVIPIKSLQKVFWRNRKFVHEALRIMAEDQWGIFDVDGVNFKLFKDEKLFIIELEAMLKQVGSLEKGK